MGACKGHGGGRRCQEEGCLKSAQGGTQRCKAHGGGMRCQKEGCLKSAAGGGTPHCIAHGGGKRCQEEGGIKSAEGDTGACKTHGGGRRCQKAVPEGRLPHRCSRRQAALSRAWRGQAVPARGLLQGCSLWRHATLRLAWGRQAARRRAAPRQSLKLQAAHTARSAPSIVRGSHTTRRGPSRLLDA
jgi:hypothetical protein